MAASTGIEWCDATFNCWRGCTKVSKGCANCYAETMSKRNLQILGQWGTNGTRIVASETQWKQPLKWNRLAAEGKLPDGSPNPDGHRPRVFCASLCDVFEDWRGPMYDSHGNSLPHTIPDIRLRLFSLIYRTPNLDWLLLTKRTKEAAEFFNGNYVPGEIQDEHIGSNRNGEPTYLWGTNPVQWPFPNIWIGTSVEDQQTADYRIPYLLKIPAKVRFLSCEPLIGPVNFSLANNRTDWKERLGKPALDGIHWVIVGGESGSEARPMHPDWARSIRDQCHTVQVPFFFKQWGEWQPCNFRDSGRMGVRLTGEVVETDGSDTVRGSHYMRRVGKVQSGNLLDGKLHQTFP